MHRVTILSINQLNAQKKFLEVWKALNNVNYPIKCSKKSNVPEMISPRAKTFGRLIEPGIKSLTTKFVKLKSP